MAGPCADWSETFAARGEGRPSGWAARPLHEILRGEAGLQHEAGRHFEAPVLAANEATLA